jgi:hypothetical protein
MTIMYILQCYFPLEINLKYKRMFILKTVIGIDFVIIQTTKGGWFAI